MQAFEMTGSDGVRRSVEGKVFYRGDKPHEFRVYRIYGDITSGEAIAELAQAIALKFQVDNVIISA